MKSPMNASYCQLLTLLSYVIPMLDELFNGEPIEVGVINPDTGSGGEPRHRVEIELPGIGPMIVETVPSVSGRWFSASHDIFDGEAYTEFAPALNARASELHEQARSFALKLHAELKNDLAAVLRDAQRRVEALSQLNLE